jgi:hypothetical protein
MKKTLSSGNSDVASDRKKPGVAFWATVAAVVVLIYIAGFPPAVGLAWRSRSAKKIVQWVYWPILCAYPYSRGIIRPYGELGMPKGAHISLDVTPPDGLELSMPFDGH